MSSFKELLKQINEPSETSVVEKEYGNAEQDADFLPLSDDLSNLILMHRNAHFGGKFEFMIEYYQSGGIGCSTDFELSDIIKLAKMQLQMKQDLALSTLSKTELEKVKNVLEIYQGLRKLHKTSKNELSIPTLLANLILTEDEVPVEEIEELSKTEKPFTYLVDLFQSEEFLDPLFPGYGKAPIHAATCLGKMKSEKAIMPLFGNMKADNFQYEEAIILALKDIGKPAFDFLLNVLKNEPFTVDNERAAICLTSFGENETFAKAALKLLENFQTLNYPNLVVHLILACLGLQDKKDIESFLEIKSQLPNAFDPDFQYVSSKLKKK